MTWTVGTIGLRGSLCIAACLLLLGGAGCPRDVHAPEPDPVAAIAAYRDALAEGRPRDAFALIHPDAREGLDLEGFLVLYSGHRDALLEQAERVLALASDAPPEQRARVMTRLGPAELVKTEEGWRLDRPVGTGR
ncbi:MAG: hypothetical protein CVU56_20020 [Deltaproteobacteria bacterium HGW-Deltaproteobacteria-14]|jgi:hypothetical protein|nr:MAG: hypothetical protein CVU56_20020 [Deltaproteobacteria bacterium HGW-Deltaproteobacteria-14]